MDGTIIHDIPFTWDGPVFETGTYAGGEAERLLGLFSRQDRERLIIATKAAYTILQ